MNKNPLAPHRLIAGVVAVLLGSTLLAGCSDDDGDATVLTVYAAASLQATFEQLAEEFEDQHDGVEVEFNFAGSSTLVAQLQEGAPADVFASADVANMDKLVAADLAADAPEIFARNSLTIAVPAGNPGNVTSLADLANPDLAVVICQPEVPCGAASVRAAEAAGVALSPDSEEESVTDVLNKVITDVADAGLVYVTDVIGAGDKVQKIDFPEASAAVNDYPIATVSGNTNEDLANAFVELVLSSTGADILTAAGFQLP